MLIIYLFQIDLYNIKTLSLYLRIHYVRSYISIWEVSELNILQDCRRNILHYSFIFLKFNEIIPTNPKAAKTEAHSNTANELLVKITIASRMMITHP